MACWLRPMLRKLLFSITLAVVLLVVPQLSRAQGSVPVYFFWGEGCPHCAAEKPFLAELERQHPEVTVHGFEVWHSAKNQKLLEETGKALGVEIYGVPLTVVGKQSIVGFLSAETTGRQIERYVEKCIAVGCEDVLGPLAGLNKPIAPPATPPIVEPMEQGGDQARFEAVGLELVSQLPETLYLPLIGEVQTKHLSLPALTLVIGALDGFNPCAMWVLVFLIGLLLGVQNVKRRWLLGGTFIAASATVYFVFMATWLNLILFIGAILAVRIVIGLVAISGGIYSLREYTLKRDEACKVTAPDKRRRLFERLKAVSQEQRLWLALGGIVLLAFAVNLVELICSAGFPAVYTQVLALSRLPHWQYYLYLLLYVFIFMLDDLIVFTVAMVTLQVTGMTTKYSRWSHLIGGAIMVIIGLLLIFRPEWLMFG